MYANLMCASSIELMSSPNLFEKTVDSCLELSSEMDMRQRIFMFGAIDWILMSSSIVSAVVYSTSFLAAKAMSFSSFTGLE